MTTGIAAAVLLVIASVWLRVRLLEAAHASDAGQGYALVAWAPPLFRDGPPDDARLAELIERYRDAGLRYIAVVGDPDHAHGVGERPGGDGAGPVEPITITDGSWSRAWLRLPPPPRPPPGADGPPPPRHPPTIVVEYVPVLAIALRRQATLVVPVALVIGALLVLSGLAIARAIGQRERLAAELERGRTLASLGEMSAVMAHELKNPLASLKGHAQLLEESLPAGGSDAKMAARVVAEAVRLEALTRDLLELVRTGEVRRTASDPSAILRAAIAEVSPDVAAELHTSALVPLDAARLHQALVNILRNAIQATPAGAAAPEASVERRGRDVVFVVRDHGEGLPRGAEHRVFEAFYTTKARGVGLGLAIARRVVELHGGTIAARNHPGGGAELSLVVPVEGT